MITLNIGVYRAIKRTACAVLVLLLLLPLAVLAGCKNSVPQEVGYTDIIFQTDIDNLTTFAIAPNAEVYAVVSGEGLGRYTYDGELLESYPDTSHLAHIHYSDGFIYAFDYDSFNVVEINPESKDIRIIHEDLKVNQVRSLCVIGDALYMIIVPFLPFDHQQPLISSGSFIKVDVKSGNLTERPEVSNPISLYLASDGKLYVYSRPDNDYLLSQYNIRSGKLTNSVNMNDVGHLFSFAYERGMFLYFGGRITGLNGKRMADDFHFNAVDDVSFS